MEAETESTGTGTATSGDGDGDNEERFSSHPTRDILAEGLMGLLKPTVDRLDECVRATRESQQELKQELDSLLDELKKISDNQTDCPELEECVKKLLNSKQRITVVSTILQTSQERLNKIHQMASKETTKRVVMLEGERSGESPAPPAADDGSEN